MQERLVREEAIEKATRMSIDEISSPVARHLLDFYDANDARDLFSIDGPSPTPSVVSADVAGPSTIADAIPTTDLISAAFSNFQSMDFAEISAILENPIPPDPPQPQAQQQQQSVPSISFNNFPPLRTQSLNSSDFSIEEDNQTKAHPASLMQISPTQMRQQGGLMGIENGAFPLQMIQQNNTDPQQYFQSGNSSNGLPISELEGIISPYASAGREHLRRIFSSGDMQVIRGSQNMMAGCSESNAAPVLATTEPATAALEESSSYKVGRLTQEERKAKIDRYIRKRNERNFKKKIKYACRKTLADSRPRVRGRFAKNDEFEEPSRRAYSNGSYDDEGTSPMAPVKEDEEALDSSDILSHISGVNSFNFTWSPDTSHSTWTV